MLSDVRVFRPDSTILLYWKIFFMISILFQLFSFPLRIAFNNEIQLLIKILDYILVIIHTMDILINLNTVFYTKKGEIKEKREEIYKNYQMTFLKRDLIGIFFMILSIIL